jgi:hypothetical protein
MLQHLQTHTDLSTDGDRMIGTGRIVVGMSVMLQCVHAPAGAHTLNSADRRCMEHK